MTILWIILSLAAAETTVPTKDAGPEETKQNEAADLVQTQQIESAKVTMRKLVECAQASPNKNLETCQPNPDPWGKPYQLIASTKCESSQVLLSLGPDGLSSEDDITMCVPSPTSGDIGISPNLNAAQPLAPLTRKQVYWLKPLKQKFPQNPYQHVDFTAYSLEWGEALLGLNTLQIGILPRTQIGAKPLLWLVGLQNADAKINAIRLGPVDFAIQGSYLGLASPEFPTSNIGAGATASLQILQPWSVHLQANYNRFNAEGLPDLDTVNDYFLDYAGIDVDDIRDKLDEQGLQFGIGAETLTLNLTSDIRFNRRDSLIFQGKAIVWHRIDISNNIDETELPVGVDLDAILSLESEGLTNISKNYLVSAAWQWSWDRAYLRLGLGWSSLDAAPYLPPILSTIDYAWRFGGKTKRSEGKIRAGWRENVKKLKTDPVKNLPIKKETTEKDNDTARQPMSVKDPSAQETSVESTSDRSTAVQNEGSQTSVVNTNDKKGFNTLRVKLKGLTAFEALLSECGALQSKTFNGSDTVRFEKVPDEMCTLQLLPMGAMIRIKGGDRRYECSQSEGGGLSCSLVKTP